MLLAKGMPLSLACQATVGHTVAASVTVRTCPSPSKSSQDAVATKPGLQLTLG